VAETCCSITVSFEVIKNCKCDTNRLWFSGRGCGGKLFNYGGVFTSPLYPMNYRNNSQCRWDVSVPIGTIPLLKFTGQIDTISKLCILTCPPITSWSQKLASWPCQNLLSFAFTCTVYLPSLFLQILLVALYNYYFSLRSSHVIAFHLSLLSCTVKLINSKCSGPKNCASNYMILNNLIFSIHTYLLKSVGKTISCSIWMIPVEWPKAEIWGLAKVFVCCLLIFTYLSHLNP
jgi:hypothetical protein